MGRPARDRVAGWLLLAAAAGCAQSEAESRTLSLQVGFEEARRQMVTEQIEARGVSDRRVLRAARGDPRPGFLPRATR